MTTRHVITVDLASDDTQSNWYALNSKFGGNYGRSYQVEVTSGDTITLDFTLDADPNTSVSSFTTTENITTDSGGVYDGGWRWFRVNKSGTNGVATIKVES